MQDKTTGHITQEEYENTPSAEAEDGVSNSKGDATSTPSRQVLCLTMGRSDR